MDWEPADKTASVPQGGSPAAPPRKKLKKWPIVIAVIVVLIAAINISNCVRNAPESLDWPKTGLATMLPEPPTSKGSVSVNSDEQFSASIEKCAADQYASYVEACKQKGFSVEAESDTTSFEAYNNKGYKLRLAYYESMEDMSIDLNAPVQMSAMTWPTYGLGALVPAPKSSQGNISVDGSLNFYATVGDTDKAAYDQYVAACEDAGFVVDRSKGDTYYDAKDKKGNSIHLVYEGFNTMTISIYAADDGAGSSSEGAQETQSGESATGESKSSSSSSKKSASSSDVDADFKAMMDEYEDFFDEYVSFMKKYQDGSLSAGAMADYANMMSEYSSYMEKLESVDTDSLSAADLAYYNKVQGRITKKLAGIGQ